MAAGVSDSGHSSETVRAALAYISPDCPRDEWARIAMAIKSELGAVGLELFDEWSSKGTTYDAAAVRSTWRSVKAGGARIRATAERYAGEAPQLRGTDPKQNAAAHASVHTKVFTQPEK